MHESSALFSVCGEISIFTLIVTHCQQQTVQRLLLGLLWGMIFCQSNTCLSNHANNDNVYLHFFCCIWKNVKCITHSRLCVLHIKLYFRSLLALSVLVPLMHWIPKDSNPLCFGGSQSPHGLGRDSVRLLFSRLPRELSSPCPSCTERPLSSVHDYSHLPAAAPYKEEEISQCLALGPVFMLACNDKHVMEGNPRPVHFACLTAGTKHFGFIQQ